MNVYDFIAKEDVNKLSDAEYIALRNYLKLLGHRVSDEFGKLGVGIANSQNECIMLYSDGDLGWASFEFADLRDGKRVPYEEAKRMAQLGMIE